jgi:hypothetical protein
VKPGERSTASGVDGHARRTREITRAPRERGTLWRLKPGSNSWTKETIAVAP